MGILKLTSEQINYLNNNYPTLTYDSINNLIIGALPFNLKYSNNGVTIIDEYQIEIDLNKVSELVIPIVRETKGRIIEIAKNKRISPKDLHINNKNGEMCLIIPPKVRDKYPNGFDLEKLLEHIQEHLYWISYYEKFNHAPWLAYGHGELGYLQLLLQDNNKYAKDFKLYFNCHSRAAYRKKVRDLIKKYKL